MGVGKGQNHTLAASSGLFFTGAYASHVSITYINKNRMRIKTVRA
jgi:hypothetical protein